MWCQTLAALAFALITGHASASGAIELSLEDCLRRALEHGPNRDAIAADLDAARARLEEAKAGRFGDSEYVQAVGLVNEARGNVLTSPNEQDDFFDGLGPFTRLELDIRLPLYTFGKLSAALESAEQGLRSERARGDAARAQTVLETKRLYYGLLLAQQLSYVLTDMLDSMDKAIETTKKRVDDESSDISELDLLRLQIGRSHFAAGVHEIEASLRLTKSALGRALGLDASEFEIRDQRLRAVEIKLGDLQHYLSDGPQRRPEWQQISSGLEAQEAAVKMREANLYPTLFLATGLRYAVASNRDDQKNPFVSDEFNFFQPVGFLGVHWDLNFFANKAKAAQARAEMEKLQAKRRDAVSGLRLDVERAYLDVDRARRTIESAKAGRKAARGLLVLSVANFDLGIGEGKDLFEAFASYTKTSTDYFQALHDFNLAVAKLSRAVGHELTALAY